MKRNSMRNNPVAGYPLRKVLRINQRPLLLFSSGGQSPMPMAALECGHEVQLSNYDRRHLEELKTQGKRCTRCPALKVQP